MNRQPTRGMVAGVLDGVRHSRRYGNEADGGERDRLRLASELEGQLAVEDVEGVRVRPVQMRACDDFARGVPARVIESSSRATSRLISRRSLIRITSCSLIGFSRRRRR